MRIRNADSGCGFRISRSPLRVPKRLITIRTPQLREPVEAAPFTPAHSAEERPGILERIVNRKAAVTSRGILGQGGLSRNLRDARGCGTLGRRRFGRRMPNRPAIENLPIAAGKFKPDDDSLKQYQYSPWFRHAKFGMRATGVLPVGEGDRYAKKLYLHDSVGRGGVVTQDPDNKWHLEHDGHPSKYFAPAFL